MLPLTVVLVLLVVVVAAVAARRRRAAPGEATVAPVLPAFKVVAIGTRGSGKTMYLASMFDELQVPSGRRGYYLTASIDDVKTLNGWRTEISDPALESPMGTTTGEIRKFAFTVQHRGAGGSRPVMGLNYVDYAGGLLTDEADAGSAVPGELMEHIRSADALVVLIDGERIAQVFAEDPRGAVYLQEALTIVVALALETRQPVNFMITKWDLLHRAGEDEDARLRQVRDLLLGNTKFHSMVRFHAAQRVVRLIPTSALGVRPHNVDVPVAAVVPDLLEQAEAAINAAEVDSAVEGIRQRLQIGPASQFRELGVFLAEKVGKSAKYFFPTPVVQFLLETAGDLYGGEERRTARLQRLNSEIVTAGRLVDEARAARKVVMQELRSRVDSLETALPSARLHG